MTVQDQEIWLRKDIIIAADRCSWDCAEQVISRDTNYKSKTPLLLKDLIDFLVLSSHFFLKAELTIVDGLLWEDHKEADIGVSANMRMKMSIW